MDDQQSDLGCYIRLSVRIKSFLTFFSFLPKRQMRSIIEGFHGVIDAATESVSGCSKTVRMPG